jgi:hypothetical protein
MAALFTICRTTSSETPDNHPGIGEPGLYFYQLSDSLKYTSYIITYF